MPIEPVKVPQNVQLEDRLIGPLTIRQVAICLIGGGISFAIWSAMKKAGMISMGHAALALIPLMIAAVFAFVKVQNLSLLRLILLLVEKTDKPAVRRWEPRAGVSINIRSYYKTQRDELPKIQESLERDKLQHLSELLDETMKGEKTKEGGGEDPANEAPSENAQDKKTPEQGDAPGHERIPTEGEEEIPQSTGVPPRPVDRNRVTVEPKTHEPSQLVDGVSPPKEEPLAPPR